MPSPREDEYSDRGRSHRPSNSPDPDSVRRRRARHDDGYSSGSRRYRDPRSSRKDSPRRRRSRSRDRYRKEYERRHPERSERFEDSEDNRRRRRDRSPEGRSHSGYRDRDSYSHQEKPSRRRRSYSRSQSPRRRSGSPSSRAPARSQGALPSQQDAYKLEVSQGGSGDLALPPEKEKPNFAPTGRLAAESNTVNVNGGTVVLKYHEPPEARKAPAKDSWRLYVFKGQDLLEMVELNERSCWLIGRERLVVDFPLDHPSCSKQHAAIQFRFVEKRNEFGDRTGKVKPYLIDLESANGSTLNGDSVPGGRYVELQDKDVLKFGLSSREYVLMLTHPD